MLDAGATRMQREVALAAFGSQVDALDPWVLDRLTASLEEEHFLPGQVLWSVGEPVDFIYFMIEGRAQARREGAPPWTFEGKWFLGAFEGLDGAPARRSLVALTDVRALKLRRRVWFDLLEDSFELTRLFLSGAATGVAQLDERRGPVVKRLRPQLEALEPSAEPLTTVERVAYLAELELVRSAGMQALVDLAGDGQDVKLADGDVLYRADEEREHVFVVVGGSVEVKHAAAEVTRQYGPGEIVGGAGSFSDRARAWNAYAKGPTRLLAFPIEAWFDLTQEHFDLALSMLRVFAKDRELILEDLAAQAGVEGLVLG